MKKKILNLVFALALVLSFSLVLTPQVASVFSATNYHLEVINTSGGSVTSPGGGVFTYSAGTIVTLVAVPNAGYNFVTWFGDVDTIADVNSAATTITMDDDYSISPSFSIDTYTLTTAAGANGSISPSGSVTVNSGGSQSFTITPNTGYRIVDVQVDGASVGAVSSYTFTDVTASHTISAGFSINTYTLTASAGANGSISPSDVVTVNYGNSQNFTITAKTGYHVADVLVDGASVGPVAGYTFTNVITDHTIAVSFAINTYTITPAVGAHGMIVPSLAVTVNYGINQSFDITPDTGYHIADVLVDGASVGPVASYTFPKVAAGHTISASFSINTYTLTTSAGANGSISPSDVVTVNYGSNQTFTIAPNTGYNIVKVLVDGTSVGAVASYTFTSVTASHTISASFSINTYTVTPAVGDHGSILPSDAQIVSYGDSQTFTINANTGYRIADVLVDGTSVGPVASYTFPNVITNHTIAVTFAIGWPFYTLFGIGVVLVLLLVFWVGRRIGTKHYE